MEIERESWDLVQKMDEEKEAMSVDKPINSEEIRCKCGHKSINHGSSHPRLCWICAVKGINKCRGFEPINSVSPATPEFLKLLERILDNKFEADKWAHEAEEMYVMMGGQKLSLIAPTARERLLARKAERDSVSPASTKEEK